MISNASKALYTTLLISQSRDEEDLTCFWVKP
jgi:hypothetical protein